MQFFKSRAKKAGLPPGSILDGGKAELKAIAYSEEFYSEEKLNDTTGLKNLKRQKDVVQWILIAGQQDKKALEALKDAYSIHPLVLEDISTPEQRPKIEYYDDYVFCVLRVISYDEKKKELSSNQLSMLFGKGFMVTVCEPELCNILEPVRKRLEEGKGRIRKEDSDYLAYSIMDVIVDGYFVALEKIGNRIEELEKLLVDSPTTKHLNQIYKLKRELIHLRSYVWPLREEIYSIEAKVGEGLLSNTTRTYMRDLYDHVVQILEALEISREMIAGMLELYLSSVSNRTNEIAKMLTIITTIFMPISFISGYYGMNFKFLPFLDSESAPLWITLIMLAVVGIMLIYFRIRRWI